LVIFRETSENMFDYIIKRFRYTWQTFPGSAVSKITCSCNTTGIVEALSWVDPSVHMLPRGDLQA